MKKIEISLDDYLIKENDRKDIINLFSKIDNKDITECDTGAKGGFNWFPVHLIIIIIGFTASGFFQEIGKDVYLKLKSKIKELLYNENEAEKIGYANIAFEINGKIIYFTFEDMLPESYYDIAFEKIFSDFDGTSKNIEKFFKSNPEELFGNFESITMKFDNEENRWVIGWFNKGRS